MIRAAEINKDQAKYIINRCFDDLRTEVDDGFVPVSGTPGIEREQQAVFSAVCIAELEASLANGERNPMAVSSAAVALGRA